MRRCLIALCLLVIQTAPFCKGGQVRTLKYREYFDRVYGGWLGKISGLTLGVPKEFAMPWPPPQVDYFAEVPDRFSDLYSGDDLYFPLLFQICLQKYGTHPTYAQYMKEWAEQLYTGRIWGANSIALEHYRAGIMPPKTGYPGYNGGHDIDAQIDLDPMGWVAPGLVNTAAQMADHAAHIMCWGDGADGAVFVAAMNSEAFFNSDVETLIRRAEAVLPPESLYRQMIDDIVRWHKQYPDWRMTRQLLAKKYNRDLKLNDIAAAVNGGAVLIGLLYGQKDFGKTVTIAMKCGWDSDCNPATAGGILGTMLGAAHIDPRWTLIFHDTYDNYCLRGLPHWLRISDIARDSVDVGERVIRETGGRVTGAGEDRVFSIIQQEPQELTRQEQFSELVVERNRKEMEEYCRTKLQGVTQGWNPLWTMTMASFENPPQVLSEYFGRAHVLKAQPGSYGVVLERTVTLPPNKHHYLQVGVAHHPNILNEQTGCTEVGSWKLEVDANSKKIGEYTVSSQGGTVVWDDVQFDLTHYAGQTVRLSLIARPNMKYTEFFMASQTSYWSEAEIISVDQPEPWR